MSKLTYAWNRLKSYGAYGNLFIFVSPTFRWEDAVLSVMNMDSQSAVRYAVDVVMCWTLVEIMALWKERPVQKPVRKRPRKKTTNTEHFRQI